MEDSDLKKLMETYNAEQRADEVVWFYRHAEKINPKVIVEIGIKEGGNLKILSTLLPEDGLAIGIDPGGIHPLPWAGEAQCQTALIKEQSLAPKAMSGLVELLAGRQIDLLFIDGDHSYEGMLGDFAAYGPLVRPGGIIAIHDIYYLEPVKRAWAAISGDKFESSYNQSSIGIGFIIKS